MRGRYRAADVALQSGARAVLALYDPRACDRCEPSAVIRLRSDGSRDRGFARKGFARPPRDGRRGSSVSAVAVAGGGRIVAAGTGSRGGGAPGFGVTRFRADGTLDRRFGRGGLAVGGSGSSPNDVLVQPNGRILVAGYENTATLSGDRNLFALARFLG